MASKLEKKYQLGQFCIYISTVPGFALVYKTLSVASSPERGEDELALIALTVVFISTGLAFFGAVARIKVGISNIFRLLLEPTRRPTPSESKLKDAEAVKVEDATELTAGRDEIK